MSIETTTHPNSACHQYNKLPTPTGHSGRGTSTVANTRSEEARHSWRPGELISPKFLIASDFIGILNIYSNILFEYCIVFE